MKLKHFIKILCVVVTLLFLTPFTIWVFQKSLLLNIVVINKTVPQNDYREHLGLFWILHHRKIVNAENHKLYDIKEDYYGYNPEELTGEKKLIIPDDIDLIYVADTYGVYEEDFRGNIRGERSEKLYGGLTFYEWNRIMHAKTLDNTLVVEFNTIQSPTDISVRRIVEQNLSIKWTGWIGRYFSNMQSEEVPIWLIENYEEQTKKDWSFKGEGIAFVHESDKVVVLDKKDINGAIQFKWTKEGKEHYEVNSNSTYTYWFDMVIPQDEMTVEAQFEIPLTNSGVKTLNAHQIQSKFPAILRNPEENMYYFAGDYADVRHHYFSKWVLPKSFYRLMAILNKGDRFFWDVYIPVMTQIFEDSYKTRSISNEKIF